jgi:hypothetical protein
MVIGRGALQLEKLRVIVRTWEDSGIVDGLGRPDGWVLAMGMLVGEKTEGMREWSEERFGKAIEKCSAGNGGV